MNSLIPILVFSLFLAYISSSLSSYKLDELGGKVYYYREKVFYTIMTLGMAVFVGLRTRGNDTYAYREIYEKIKLGSSVFSGINWKNLSGAPGLQLLEHILKSWGATTQDYLMVCALISICIYLWFIHKYSTDIWLSVYYFITMGVYTFAMAAVKQTLAVAFLMIATDRAIQKKWFGFLFWVVIAELFHPFAFVYLIIPFLAFSPWSNRSIFLIAGTVAVSFMLSRLTGGIMSLTEALGAGYDEESFNGAGVNIFRVLVVWVPVVISYFGRRKLQRSNDRTLNIIINASMINALIMFIGLFGTANYFARLANYFLIFQTLSLPFVFRFFDKRNRNVVIGVSLISFAAYFYYQCVLAQGSFDSTYAFMRFTQYFSRSF